MITLTAEMLNTMRAAGAIAAEYDEAVESARLRAEARINQLTQGVGFGSLGGIVAELPPAIEPAIEQPAVTLPVPALPELSQTVASPTPSPALHCPDCQTPTQNGKRCLKCRAKCAADGRRAKAKERESARAALPGQTPTPKAVTEELGESEGQRPTTQNRTLSVNALQEARARGFRSVDCNKAGEFFIIWVMQPTGDQRIEVTPVDCGDPIIEHCVMRGHDWKRIDPKTGNEVLIGRVHKVG